MHILISKSTYWRILCIFVSYQGTHTNTYIYVCIYMYVRIYGQTKICVHIFLNFWNRLDAKFNELCLILWTINSDKRMTRTCFRFRLSHMLPMTVWHRRKHHMTLGRQAGPMGMSEVVRSPVAALSTGCCYQLRRSLTDTRTSALTHTAIADRERLFAAKVAAGRVRVLSFSH